MIKTKPYETALVLGLGRSGEAAARLLAGEGTAVTVADEGDSPELSAKAELLRAESISVQLGCNALPGEFEICIVSPGIPADSDLFRAVCEAGIAVYPELELGLSRMKSSVLGITGSNGKSTLTKLCAESIEAAGLSAIPAGNYGTPVSELAACGENPDWLVVEVSSFQLETIQAFRPSVGVILNVLPNHLDRHENMGVYRAHKMRMFENMIESDTAVIPVGQSDLLGDVVAPRVLTFGNDAAADYRFDDGVVHAAQAVDFRGTLFEGEVMGQSAAAACAAISACGIDVKSVAATASRFKGLPHRLQTVDVVNGVRFINDSKATNLGALSGALKNLGKGVRLIAGGRIKEGGLESIIPLLKLSVLKAYLIGEASDIMYSSWSEAADCMQCGDLESAVNSAFEDADEGDTILLSPACASYDQFKNFEMRGNRFVELVQTINK